jgi:phage tail sheath protein FI
MLDHWHEQAFAAQLRPMAGSFLSHAVRGFFANGGKRCLVVGVKPSAAGVHSDALVRAVQAGGLLDDRTDIDLVCMPDAACQAVLEEGEGACARVQAAVLAHCAAMGDRFALLDAPLGVADSANIDAIEDLKRLAGSLRSAFGAMYHPWIKVSSAQVPPPFSAAPGEWRSRQSHRSRASQSEVLTVPPCGHIAGLIARLDAQVGPQRAPANERLNEVVDTSVAVGAAQYASLNDAGVNCLRGLYGQGVHVVGGRTLSGHAGWRHVSTVRVVLAFRRWLASGLRDFVFEPHTPQLWDRIRLRLVSHCLALQKAGALVGEGGLPGFFVQCDAETNPPEAQQLGRVVAHVGLAPTVPAEFIVVRVIQDASGSTVSGLS